MPRRRGMLVSISCLALAGLHAAPASADVGGPEIVSFLNAQRAAHGIPAGIVEDPALSSGCARHNAYGRLNDSLSHFEDPELPGYSPEGDQAGKTSVLYAGGGPWTAALNPFEQAPIHLHQLLAPRLDRMGAAENGGWGCATTLASRQRPAPPADVTYTYPGDGATGWPASQLAAELPYTPGELVGIPAGTTTGPYLYVMFDGPQLSLNDAASATGASLTGPDGPVDVVAVDNVTPRLEGLLPTGLELIPRAPLRPFARYTASVAASVSSVPFAKTWTFTTGGLANAVRITQTTMNGGHVEVFVTSTAPGARVTATGPGPTQSQPVDATGKAALGLGVDGTWRFCARSGGSPGGYALAEDCIESAISGPVTYVVRGPPGSATPKTITATPPAIATPPATATPRPFAVSVPRSVRRGSRIRVAITSTARFTMGLRLTGAGGRTLTRLRTRSFRGARTPRAFRVAVPAPYSRGGRSVRLTMVVGTRGKRYTVRHTIRVLR